MILKESNLMICQMKLIEEIDNILRLISVSQNNLLEDISKQSFPLLYEMCLENMSTRFEDLKKRLTILKFEIGKIQ